MIDNSEAPEPFDAGDARQVKGRRNKLKRAEINSENTIRAMLSSPEARALIWDQLSLCGIFSCAYHSDAGAMYFAEGQRNVGLRLLALIPPDIYHTMTVEAAALEKEQKDA